MLTYQLNWSSNSLKTPISLQENQLDNSSTSFSLYGYGYIGWAAGFQQNMLRLLENFANTNPPNHATIGQLWFDSNANVVKVFKGSDGWVSINVTINDVPPSSPSIGQLWIDSQGQALNFWTGTAWNRVVDGNEFSQTTNDIYSRFSAQDVTNTNLNTSITTVNNALNAHATDMTVHLTSTQNALLDGIDPSVTSVQVNLLQGLSVNVQGALNQKVNKSGDVMTGALTLNGDPKNVLHAATKNYVDSTVAGQISNLQSSIQGEINGINTTINSQGNAINSNTNAIGVNASNIASNASSISNLNSQVTAHGTAINSLNSSVSSNTSSISTNSSNIANLTSEVNTLNNEVADNTNQINTNASNIAQNTTAINTKVNRAGDTMNGPLIVQGDITVGSTNSSANTNASGNRLVLLGASQNTDDLWLSRYDVSSDYTQLRIAIGDNTGGDDSLVIGTTPGGVWSTLFQFYNNGVMTVKDSIQLPRDPTSSVEAARKGYVDNSISNALANFSSRPNVVVLTGQIGHGGTIPLPSGFTQSQCSWMAAAGIWGNFGGQSQDGIDSFYAYADSSRIVHCYTTNGGTFTGTANYIIIGVK